MTDRHAGVQSTRDQIRTLAEEVLLQHSEPMHNSLIANVVLPRLGLADSISRKTVNTCLHDDPEGRFIRVGAGTWTLRTLRR